MKRILPVLLALFLLAARAVAQQAAPAPGKPPAAAAGPEFFRAADEVLQEMSQLLSLPVEKPLKKSVRSREEIRAYVIQEMKEDKEPGKRYADQKALEAFGLLPSGFNLDGFLVDLLTEQIAGLYDPKAGEFYIADWIPVTEQRMVMAHELTHALDDQHFHIDAWMKAARPNDDAELARGAVLEGSALAAMVDYQLHEMNQSVPGMRTSIRDLADLEPLIHEAMGAMKQSPAMAKAPPFLRDALVFPYLSGAAFTQQVLKAGSGWADFQKVFANPPVSTQQILHPKLYFLRMAPDPVTLPEFGLLVPRQWKKLDENIFGEFGLEEVLKQFLGADRAGELAPEWDGDRYAIFENQQNQQLLLVFRLRLASPVGAARFFGNYSEGLELKHKDRKDLFRRPNFFQFSTEQGGVFLRCLGDQCLSVEGSDRSVFDGINRAIGWPPAPRPAEPLPHRDVAQVAAVLTAH